MIQRSLTTIETLATGDLQWTSATLRVKSRALRREAASLRAFGRQLHREAMELWAYRWHLQRAVADELLIAEQALRRVAVERERTARGGAT